MRKVALITGATSGLGKEMARLLASGSYDLVVTGRKSEGFTEFTNNPHVRVVQGDIRDVHTQEQLVTLIHDTYRRLDVLIHNAGISYIQPFEDTTESQLTTIYETNLKAPILLTHALYELMKQQKSSTIVFINSAAGKQGYPSHTLYSSMKFALNGFAQSLRQEARKYGMRIISIFPGGIKTNLYDTVKQKPDIEKYMDPVDVAKLVVSMIETNGLSPDELSISRMTK